MYCSTDSVANYNYVAGFLSPAFRRMIRTHRTSPPTRYQSLCNSFAQCSQNFICSPSVYCLRFLSLCTPLLPIHPRVCRWLGSTWNEVGLLLTVADVFDVGVLNQASFLLHVVVIVCRLRRKNSSGHQGQISCSPRGHQMCL